MCYHCSDVLQSSKIMQFHLLLLKRQRIFLNVKAKSSLYLNLNFCVNPQTNLNVMKNHSEEQKCHFMSMLSTVSCSQETMLDN